MATKLKELILSAFDSISTREQNPIVARKRVSQECKSEYSFLSEEDIGNEIDEMLRQGVFESSGMNGLKKI